MPLTYANFIRSVKQGKYEAEEIQKFADDLLVEARDAYARSPLPTNCDVAVIEKFTINEVGEYMRSL